MTYYWKTEGDMYHWHRSCHLVPDDDVETNPEWVVSNVQPISKKQCNHCKNKD